MKNRLKTFFFITVKHLFEFFFFNPGKHLFVNTSFFFCCFFVVFFLTQRNICLKKKINTVEYLLEDTFENILFFMQCVRS